MNLQKPVTVSSCDKDAGPVVQSSLTYDRDAELEVVKCEGSKVMEPTWEDTPASLDISIPLYDSPPGV